MMAYTVSGQLSGLSIRYPFNTLSAASPLLYPGSSLDETSQVRSFFFLFSAKAEKRKKKEQT